VRSCCAKDIKISIAPAMPDSQHCQNLSRNSVAAFDSSKLTSPIKNLISSKLFIIFAALALVLAATDGYFLFNHVMSHGIRGLLLASMLLILCLTGIEQFYIVAAAVQMPNLLILLFLSMRFGVPQFFFTGLFGHIVVSAGIFAFYWQHSHKYISDDSFSSLKADLKYQEEENMQKLLYFSLLGCLRDKTKVLSQAYHVLDNFFKAEKAVIYLADHEKNLLIPNFRPGSPPDSSFQPILVKPDFWRKHSYDPDKGMLSLISGKTSLHTLRQLIPESSADAGSDAAQCR